MLNFLVCISIAASSSVITKFIYSNELKCSLFRHKKCFCLAQCIYYILLFLKHILTCTWKYFFCCFIRDFVFPKQYYWFFCMYQYSCQMSSSVESVPVPHSMFWFAWVIVSCKSTRNIIHNIYLHVWVIWAPKNLKLLNEREINKYLENLVEERMPVRLKICLEESLDVNLMLQPNYGWVNKAQKCAQKTFYQRFESFCLQRRNSSFFFNAVIVCQGFFLLLNCSDTIWHYWLTVLSIFIPYSGG